ncbi:MAG: virulence factor SrfB, partial [Candidatus Symbiothrix sp.]|nr:virulence factor SrfB [Candidatus Symbiothrix sp.]
MENNNSVYTLMANSGIQFLKTEIELNPNEDVTKALRFHDYFDKKTCAYYLKSAVYLTNQDKWVTKESLKREGFINNDTEKLLEEKINLNDLDIIDIEIERYSINNFDTNIRGSLYREKTAIEHFEKVWLPVPYFEKDENGKSQNVPVNWARMMLSPKNGNGKKGSRFYDVILAFDTRATEDDRNSFSECPILSIKEDTKKVYSLCNNTDILLEWVNSKQCAWLDEYLIKLMHGDAQSVPAELPHSKYKAYYIYLMHYLQQKGDFPEIILFNDRANDEDCVSVDLVLDIGNSRTCGLLFENSDFTKVSMLELQDLTLPVNTYSNPFDMRLAFREAKFGEIDVQYSKQFTYPSILRIGEEASWLIYNAKPSENGGVEKVTNYSSPKRYLWDSEPFSKQWEFIL